MAKVINKPEKDAKRPKSGKKESAVPISEQTKKQVSETKETYGVLRQMKINRVVDIYGSIQHLLTVEEQKMLLNGFKFEKGVVKLLDEVEEEEEIKFGENAFRGLIALQSLAENSIPARKEEFIGSKNEKRVFIPLSDYKLEQQLFEIGKALYKMLFYGMQIERCNNRIAELNKEVEPQKTSLEDFLPKEDVTE